MLQGRDKEVTEKLTALHVSDEDCTFTESRSYVRIALDREQRLHISACKADVTACDFRVVCHLVTRVGYLLTMVPNRRYTSESPLVAVVG